MVGQEEQKVDTAITDTIVIRWPQNKVQIQSSGVKKILPKLDIKKPNPVKKKVKRFVPLSFWDSENQFSININEVNRNSFIISNKLSFTSLKGLNHSMMLK